jgi:hypothetical protein
VPAFGQSTYATVSGFGDGFYRRSGARSISEGDEQRHGVVSTAIGNDTGTFNIPSLLPGTYTVSCGVAGLSKGDLHRGHAWKRPTGSFELYAEGFTQSQSVEVSVAADTAIATSNASVGEVLSQQRVTDLPIVGNNVLSFLSLMPGVPHERTMV